MTREELKAAVQLVREAATAIREAVWEAGIADYDKATACTLGLCGEVQVLEDALAMAETPESEERAKRKLQSRQHQQKRAWAKVENEVRQWRVMLAKLDEMENGKWDCKGGSDAR
jgi:hypothetical protein